MHWPGRQIPDSLINEALEGFPEALVCFIIEDDDTASTISNPL